MNQQDIERLARMEVYIENTAAGVARIEASLPKLLEDVTTLKVTVKILKAVVALLITAALGGGGTIAAEILGKSP